MPLPNDIEVEMTFLRPEEGGRNGPIFSGYRGQFYYEGYDWDAPQTFIGVEKVHPGDTVRAHLGFLSPHMHVGRLHPGMEFLIREGSRTMAKGKVLQVLDLEKSARNFIERNRQTPD